MGALSERRADIEQAKGLAILFVVFGHIVARADPLHVLWYEPLRRAIYSFHMPFFLYLSGYVTVLSGALFTPPAKWRGLAAARARRLLLPFLALGMLITCGKLAAARFVFVDNRPAALGAGLEDLFWHTAQSPALSIWYLFVLFGLSVTLPVLLWLDHSRLRLALLVTLALYVVPLPAYVYLDHIGEYAVFFVLGAVLAGQGREWERFIDRYWRFLTALLLGALALVAWRGSGWPEKPMLLSIGIVSMPALHGLVRHAPIMFAPVFLWLGRNCFMIYLFNTICIGLAKGVLLRFTDWDGGHFLPFAVALMLAGSLGPVLLKQALPHHFRPIARHTA